jgi:hypothetical protein
LLDHLVTADEADFVPALSLDADGFIPDADATAAQIVDGKVKTSKWLEELGVDDDATVTEAQTKAATEAFLAMTAPLDAEKQKQALAKVEVPEAVKHLVGMLTAYDWAFVEQAKNIRGFCIASLLEEAKHPDAKIRLRALELLGKVTEVALFTERVEVKKTELSDAELQTEIDKRMGDYMRLMKVVEGQSIPVDPVEAEILETNAAATLQDA